ncbi:hypothetical protein F1737_10500 [Methanoplanus sp. FWC-SCC4]|uniref:Uncharacterized protein n=1 Tax=Methanochimaera problematica TaxID=2609417 RepID=A0AA97FF03_9EURY|nr:hypothetical protein [Methanoplanus sp. FWC-SCC4]WOF17073.1 hypothetical protein F1737_10500 [Methanoplanus sp. FWC-SCC4]
MFPNELAFLREMNTMSEVSKKGVFNINKKIIRFEKEIKNNTEREGEVCGIFSEKGELLCWFAGFSALMITNKECPETKGTILTHNHVSDSSFSKYDLKTASELKLKEIRVAGFTAVYSMKPSLKSGTGEWPAPDVIVRRYEEISRDRHIRSKINELMAVLESSASKKEGNIEILKVKSDLICEKLAKDLGLLYSKGRWVG